MPSSNVSPIFSFYLYRKDEKEYALKQIEGTGISMSACREIAVSYSFFFYCRLFLFNFKGKSQHLEKYATLFLSEIEMRR